MTFFLKSFLIGKFFKEGNTDEVKVHLVTKYIEFRSSFELYNENYKGKDFELEVNNIVDRLVIAQNKLKPIKDDTDRAMDSYYDKLLDVVYEFTGIAAQETSCYDN